MKTMNLKKSKFHWDVYTKGSYLEVIVYCIQGEIWFPKAQTLSNMWNKIYFFFI